MSRTNPQNKASDKENSYTGIYFGNYDKALENLDLGSSSDENDLTKEQRGKFATKAELGQLNGLMVGVIIVLLVTIVGVTGALFISLKDSADNKAESYNALRSNYDNLLDQIHDIELKNAANNFELQRQIDKKADK